MADKYVQFDPVTGAFVEVEATETSTGAGDAGKIPALGPDGQFDPSIVPPSVEITEDVNWTIDPAGGADFQYIDDAFLAIQQRPVSAAHAPSDYADKRGVRYNLTLADGTHVIQAPNSNARLDGISAMITLTGSSYSAVNVVGRLVFADCGALKIDNISLDEIMIAGGVCRAGYLGNVQWNKLDLERGSSCDFVSGGGAVGGGIYLYGASDLYVAGPYLQPLVLNSASYGIYVTAGSRLVCYSNLELTNTHSNGAGITLNNGSTAKFVGNVDVSLPNNAGGYAINVSEGAVAQVGGTLTSDTTSATNLTINQLQKDGSAIWVGGDATKQTFEDTDYLTPAHEAAPDPHPQYLTQAEGDAAYDALGSASTVQTNLDTHEADTSNPHAVTAAQAGADPAGTAAAAIVTHEADADPHPQYLTPEELPSTIIMWFSTDPNALVPAYYDLCYQVNCGDPEQTLDTLITGPDILLGTWLLNQDLGQDFDWYEVPSTTYMDASIISGNAGVDIYAEGWVRHSNGVEELVATSDTHSVETGGVEHLHQLHMTLTNFTGVSTDRAIIRIYGTRTGSGSNPTLRLYMQGARSSRQTTTVPLAAYPAPHAVSHESGGADELLHQNLNGAGTNTHAQIDSHIANTANPHAVTAAQAGADPAGTAAAAVAAHEAAADPHTQYLTTAEGDAAYDALGAAATVQSALDAHEADTLNPHSVTHAQLPDKGTNSHTDIDVHLASSANPHSVAHSQLADKGTNDHAAIDSHLASTSNPHGVVHAQLADKGTNDHAAIDSHLANTSNPHSVTTAQIGAAEAAHTHTLADVTDSGTMASQDDVVSDNNEYVRKNQAWQLLVKGDALIHEGLTPPGSPTTKTLWHHTGRGIIYKYYTDANSSQWVAVAAVSGGYDLILGTNYIANGHFTTDTSGWVAGSGVTTATFTAVGGKGRFSKNSDSLPRWVYTGAHTAGTYLLKASAKIISGNSWHVFLIHSCSSTGTGGSYPNYQILNSDTAPGVTEVIDWEQEVTVSNERICLMVSGTGTLIIDFDDIGVYEVPSPAAAIDFPASPTKGDTHQDDYDNWWTFDGDGWIRRVATLDDFVQLESEYDAHAANVSNPHTVTHAQLSDKGTNDHAAIDSHLASTANPHSVTAAQAGAEPDLGNPSTDGYVLSSTAAGARSWIPSGGGVNNNYSATVDPTADDDSGSGYAVGSGWVNTVRGTKYTCVDASVGAAVWINTTEQGVVSGVTIVTGTSYNITIDDAAKILYCTNSSPVTVSAPAAGVPEGFNLCIVQGGTGAVTLSSSATLGSYAKSLTTNGKYDYLLVARTKVSENVNYFGDGSDGVLSTTGNVNVGDATVDGETVVMQYTSLTINAGHTLTTQVRKRALVVYVQGDCVIDGTLSMTARGAAADPVALGVPAGGLTFARKKSGQTASGSSDISGMGTAVELVEANQPTLSSDGKIYTIPRAGAAGSAGADDAFAVKPTAGTNLQTGGGSGGGRYVGTGRGGDGAAGTCFSGGAGGGGCVLGTYTTDNDGRANGGAGGNSYAGNSDNVASTGVGNPAGGGQAGGDGNGTIVVSNSGTGGLLVLIVGGNLTIGASGSVECKGVQAAGVWSWSATGGSSGGGAALILHGGTLTNNGTISMAGGAQAPTTDAEAGGNAGGDGSYLVEQVDAVPADADEYVVLGADGGSGLLDKLDATAAPTVSDDSSAGYAVGSKWIDVTNDNAYICVDASVGAAVWSQINGGGSVGTASVTPVFSGAHRSMSADAVGIDFTSSNILTETYLDTSDWDTDTWWSNTKHGFVVPNGVSKIRVTAQLGVAASGVGRTLTLRHYNSSDVLQRFLNQYVTPDDIGTVATAICADTFSVSPGDYFTFTIFADGDTTTNVLSDRTYFAIEALEGSILDVAIPVGGTASVTPVFSGAMRHNGTNDITGVDVSTGLTVGDTYLIESAYDTDGWWDSVNDGFVVPDGVTKIAVSATVVLSNLAVTDQQNIYSVNVYSDTTKTTHITYVQERFFGTSWSGSTIYKEIDVLPGNFLQFAITCAGATNATIKGPSRLSFAIRAIAGSILDVAVPAPATTAMPFAGAKLIVGTELTNVDYSTETVFTEAMFDTVDFDTDSWWSNTYDGFVIPAGVTKVRVTGNVTMWGAGSVTNSGLYLKHYDDTAKTTTLAQIQGVCVPATSTTQSVSVSEVFDVTEGELIQYSIVATGDTAITIPADRASFSIEAIAGDILAIQNVIQGGVKVPVNFAGAKRKVSANLTTKNYSTPFKMTEAELDTSVFDTHGFWSDASDGFVIPAGVTKVRVYATTIFLDLATATSSSLTIKHFDDAAETTQINSWQEYGQTDGQFAACISQLVDVQAGEKLTMNLYSTDTSITVVGAGRTEFALEVVEGSLIDQQSSMLFKGARRYNSSNKISLDFSTTAPLSEAVLDTEDFDTDGFWSDTYDGFVIPAGVKKVRVNACVAMSDITAGTLSMLMVKHYADTTKAVTNFLWQTRQEAMSDGWSTHNVSQVFSVSAGNLITMELNCPDTVITVWGGTRTDFSIEVVE